MKRCSCEMPTCHVQFAAFLVRSSVLKMARKRQRVRFDSRTAGVWKKLFRIYKSNILATKVARYLLHSIFSSTRFNTWFMVPEKVFDHLTHQELEISSLSRGSASWWEEEFLPCWRVWCMGLAGYFPWCSNRCGCASRISQVCIRRSLVVKWVR